MRILSIDGGGVRNIACAHWLDVLRLGGGVPLNKRFDMVVGVSAGAILAAMVASGHTDVPATGQMFRGQPTGLYADDFARNTHRVFPSGWKWFWNYMGRTLRQGISAPKYDHKPFEQELKTYFGDMRMGDLPITTLIVGYDTIKQSAVVFKSDDPRHSDLPVWAVVMGSAAAPTYFPSVGLVCADGRQTSIIDGGVVSNNPALCGIAEARQRGVKLDDITVISMGVPTPGKSISLEQGQEWGRIQWAVRGLNHSPIFDVLFGGPNDANDYIARQLLADRYVRYALWNVNQPLDDASPKSLKKLYDAAAKYLTTVDGQKALQLTDWLL